MTDDEYKFLEAFYNRGSIQEQSLVNYLNGYLPESLENKKEYIDGLFAKFKEMKYIDLEPKSNAIYQITALGKEKFEELNERKEINRRLEHLSSGRSRFHFNSRVWVTLIIVIVIVSVITSVALNHWHNVEDLFEKIFK
ncbi:MAG: hypothetical protein JST75_07960 [Bacteroidetes bacterium]|nr:hypothetical protein [Bacteroidota bacterium]